MKILSHEITPRRIAWSVGGLVAAVALGVGLWVWAPWSEPTAEASKSKQTADTGPDSDNPTVTMDLDQQKALGVTTAPVQLGQVDAVLDAPGQVVPDESQYAYITPRARGVVREVSAQIGQRVKKGDLLATIDSSTVANSRLELIDSLLRLEIARAKLNWQESIYQNSLSMIDALRSGRSPEEIQQAFANKPVGQTREDLLRAYAQFYLARITSERYANLRDKEAVSVALAQQKTAQYQVDQAVYQGMMDRMAFDVTLEYTQAKQAQREAQTSVKVARESLRVQGVPVDEIIQRFVSGELTGHKEMRPPKETIRQAAESAIEPSRDVSDLLGEETEPVSTYELRAPFAGTILERERIVPGVVVDDTHRLFTMANIDNVWVEAQIHESDFDLLTRSKGGHVDLKTPSYPGETFPGKVIYTGDQVDQESRTVHLLASAPNPDRKLKPGMFVNVAIQSARSRSLPRIPDAALLTTGTTRFVYVQLAPTQFERRDVTVGDRAGDQITITHGLKAGERIVTAHAFEVKSKAATKTGGGPAAE